MSALGRRLRSMIAENLNRFFSASAMFNHGAVCRSCACRKEFCYKRSILHCIKLPPRALSGNETGPSEPTLLGEFWVIFEL